MTDKTDRVMIFIDGSNMYHSLKAHFNRTDLDIGRFCHKLLEKRWLIRIYYYNAQVGRKEEPERYQHQQSFFAIVNAIYLTASCVWDAWFTSTGLIPLPMKRALIYN